MSINKIDGSYKLATPETTAKATSRPAPEAQAKSVADSVSLSPLASTIQAADKAPVNSARVQEIKEAIAQGKFKINPEKIADGLLDMARELAHGRQGNPSDA